MPDDDLLGLTDWPGGIDDELNVVERADLREINQRADLRRDIEQLLRARKYAYTRVFTDGGSTPEDRALVLADLGNFCRKKRSTGDANPHIAARLDGRREVVLRIDEYLDLSIAQLIELKVPELSKGDDVP